MDDIDLNLLVALDVLLAERSVTRAATRLALSTSAMSRTLRRLRETTGDSLLVRAGRELVPTPRAEAIRPRVHAAAREARALLTPADDALDLAQLTRRFTLRANRAFIEAFASDLVIAVAEAAPGVRLCFVGKPAKTMAPLRDGAIDLDIGVVENAAPEMRARPLFRDHYVGVVRAGHPALSGTHMTASAYAGCGHIDTAAGAGFSARFDAALDAAGHARDVLVDVPEFADALRLAAATDLVALVPRSCLPPDDDAGRRHGEWVVFDLPIDMPDFLISLLWHPRFDGEPAHRWLRDVVSDRCRHAAGTHGTGGLG